MIRYLGFAHSFQYKIDSKTQNLEVHPMLSHNWRATNLHKWCTPPSHYSPLSYDTFYNSQNHILPFHIINYTCIIFFAFTLSSPQPLPYWSLSFLIFLFFSFFSLSHFVFSFPPCPLTFFSSLDKCWSPTNQSALKILWGYLRGLGSTESTYCFLVPLDQGWQVYQSLGHSFRYFRGKKKHEEK